MSLLQVGLRGGVAGPEPAAHAVEGGEDLEAERGGDRPAFRTGGAGAAGAMVIHDTSADGVRKVILQRPIRMSARSQPRRLEAKRDAD